jgi:hypothetical protein
VQRNKFHYFDTLKEYIKESGKLVSNCKKYVITEYVRQIQSTFEEYFPPQNVDNNWMTNPFTGSFQIEDFAIKEYKELQDIANDSVSKQKFPTLSSLWASLAGVL